MTAPHILTPHLTTRLVIYYSQSITITITFENIQSITITFQNFKSITITITLASITSITFYYILHFYITLHLAQT